MRLYKSHLFEEEGIPKLLNQSKDKLYSILKKVLRNGLRRTLRQITKNCCFCLLANIIIIVAIVVVLLMLLLLLLLWALMQCAKIFLFEFHD